MKYYYACIVLIPLLLTACNTSKRPEDPGKEHPKTGFLAWGRIGAQTISDNYTGTPIIKKIMSGSPASAAGLMEDDRIITIDGIDAPEMDIALYIQCLKPGKTTLFSVQRGTQKIEVSIKIGAYPPLEQLVLMCYHSSVYGDYQRAHELLGILKKKDTSLEKTVQIQKLEQRLRGLAVTPDAQQSYETLAGFAEQALTTSRDGYRALQIVEILKKRPADSAQKALLDTLQKKMTNKKGIKK